jgi:hypothetical protein
MVSAVGPVSDARNRGLIYVINVDDDNYDDVEGNTASNDINLGLPHSLRDNNLARHVGVPVSDPPTSCTEPSYNNGNIGPVRLSNLGLATGFFYADTGVADSPFAPNLHRVQCGVGSAVYELSVVAGHANRDTLFPDLGRTGVRGIEFGPTPTDEEIVVAWEGVLTHDPVASQRRGGRMLRLDSSRMDLQAPGGLLCSLGAEDGDILRLVGCNADVDCAEGIETCVVHPEQPQGLNGLCMPRDRANDLTSRCRDLLVTARVFTMTQVGQGRALLLTRPATLPASPIEGCTDAGQCSVIEDDILDRTEFVNGQPNGTFPRHMYVCEVDPGMGGPPRCIPSCTTDADCQSGSVCAGERCVLAPIPTAECVSALQRYEVRAGDSFVVLSSTNSFKHRQMVDPQSGRCVENTTLSPLIANRIRRMEPACGDLSATTVGPNPCTRTDLMEPLLTEGTLGLRPAYGMRIRSPGVTFDITDVAFRNAAGGNVLVSTIPSGHFFTMSIAGGFQPMVFLLTAPLPERLRPAPDGSLWIVDSGDSSASLTRGQLLFMTQDGVSEVRLR